ncbi:hypothetical protein HO543_01535 [Streptococcus suis]|nr:hypothetical protein [Streptococcus suis]NQJ76056.1 hypothetical protein [Streptococcus suis]
MYKLDFIVNGGLIFPIGVYDTKEDVKQAICRHIYSYSAIQRPVFRTSGSDEVKRVDYGACDCYFLVREVEVA